MSGVRFYLMTIATFAIAFIGMSLGPKVLPATWHIAALPAARAVAPQTARVEPPTTQVEPILRRSEEPARPVRSEAEKARDGLRISLMQASIGYKLSPCDATMKANLVAALINYTNAWADMAGCRFEQCGGNDKQADDAATAFKTAADVQVHRELQAAFEQGGITRDDFPQSVRTWVMKFSDLPFGDPTAACTAGRRADNVQR